MSWAENYKKCINCDKTNHKHVVMGVCQKCYTEMEKDIQPIVKTKKYCLKCDKEFMSSGAGNRRCEDCLRRESNANYHGRQAHKTSINVA